jgi:hypothetical protein
VALTVDQHVRDVRYCGAWTFSAAGAR